MTKRHYGILAGLAGAAAAVWFYRAHAQRALELASDYDRGEVIFSNTPKPTEV